MLAIIENDQRLLRRKNVQKSREQFSTRRAVADGGSQRFSGHFTLLESAKVDEVDRVIEYREKFMGDQHGQGRLSCAGSPDYADQPLVQDHLGQFAHTLFPPHCGHQGCRQIREHARCRSYAQWLQDR
ncbi:hypothetical protein D3C85_471560 [compost metagenome]